MTMQEIYEQFTAGSQGFVAAVETHGGYDISRDEIERIAEMAESPEEFNRIWQNEAWWIDTFNETA